MATPNWTGRQGDRAKPFPFTCEDANGPVNISTATAVKFHLSQGPGRTALINAACTVIDDGTLGLRGMGEYRWAPGDTDDLVGLYMAEIEVTFATGLPLTFPDGKGAYSLLEFSKELA